MVEKYEDFKLGDRTLSSFGGFIVQEDGIYNTDVAPSKTITTEKILGQEAIVESSYDPRVIHLDMLFENKDLNADELSSWFKSKPQWFNYIGSDRKIEVTYREQLQLDTYNPIQHRMQIKLYAYNPYWIEIEPYIWRQISPVSNQQYAFVNKGNTESYPLIKLYSSVTSNITFEVNGIMYYIEDLSGELIIDCKYGQVYKPLEGGKKQTKLNTFFCREEGKSRYYMPILNVGSNTFKLLKGNLDKVEIKCNSRWI